MQSVLDEEIEQAHDDFIADYDEGYRPDSPETPNDYQRTVHCKRCKATIQISKASWSDPESDLQAAGWSCTLKDNLLLKTLCPKCSVPPPPVPDRVVQTLLETIETTVEPRSRKRLAQLRQVRATRVNHFREYDVKHNQTDYINALEQCSEQYAVYKIDDQLEVHPIRCRKRACPICEGKRLAHWHEKLKPLLKSLSAPKHITLTLRSSDDPLEDQLDRLTRSFRRLRQRTLWKRRNPWGVWLIEITYNANSGRWHPHIHIMCNMPFLHMESLREAWYEITGDSYMVGIRALAPNKAAEFTKYIAKASSIFLAPIDPFRLNAVLKGRRLVQPFGHWPDLPPLPKPRCKYLGTVADLLWKGRCGDLRAQTLCEIIRERWPQAMLSAIQLPRPPNLPARSPKQLPRITRPCQGNTQSVQLTP